ncbi:cyclophane-containing peptide 2OG-Fe(II) oxygenase YhhC [Sphaerotilus sp.]|uniref:cyclophane-containing peptide 2OG-Fe(II) oxygenase YhhC n=1 Tax=Sphaerotilus sp. TaxID=2093942 RepID=UPI00286E9206|nr:cyclophane-containing peptide 2OG-Fe(II) oxygenase YhhC [Sphaerotilus sp.]
MILHTLPSTLRADPFPHVCTTQAFNFADSLKILSWLEKDAPWKLKLAEFYEQYEFSFNQLELPCDIGSIFNNGSLINLREKLERTFKTNLSNRIDITAHKLVKGQRIRIHNDFIPNEETHRVLIQLNRAWSSENGGILMMFGSRNAEDLRNIYNPAHNTSIAFEISPISYHAVSPINFGDRYTLVLSFYGK